MNQDTGDKRLFLLDAYALIFRAYYALIRMPRITQSGFNTSAVFGFVNTLEEVLRKEKPTHIAVCFDPQGPTFRKEASSEYKSERAAMPEDIRLSVPYIKDIIRAYNIPVVEVAGFEADDVIGTLSSMAEKEGYTTYMMSPDKDFGQLVTPRIIQYKPSYRGQDFELRGPEEVCQRYGLQNTAQVIDLLALMGDKVDNIPGCPGVGEKTAVKLIQDFGSVENLLANTDKLKGALQKKIVENTRQIEFSKFLATIRRDVPVEVTPADLERKPEDKAKLMEIFKELEFKQLADRVSRRIDADRNAVAPKANTGGFPTSLFDDMPPLEAPVVEEAPKALDKTGVEYRLVDNGTELDALRRALDDKTRIGLFLVSEGENDMSCVWRGTAVAVEKGKAYYIPADYDEGTALVLDVMSMPAIEKVTVAAKRDMVIASRRRGDDVESLTAFYDLALAHYVLQPEMRHGLEALASTYLNYDMQPYPGLTTSSKRGTKTQQGAGVPNDVMSEWACEAADISLQLYEPLSEEVKKFGMDALLRDLEFPLVPVLASMELTGVRIDTKALDEAAQDMEQRLSELEQKIYSLAGMEFNIGSPSKVGEVLFDVLQLDPKAKKTKTGQYSTAEDVLEKLVSRHPVVQLIMDYRAMKKLLSTYLQALPAAINPVTGKVHTNYNQTVTATGRISSTAPNLQNIPVREALGREIRRAFIPDEGCLFLSADYSQIELRLMADFSHDPIMVDAFLQGEDVHAITAAKIFHKDVKDVTADERRAAKTANFGILYGISAFGLSSRLGIPRAEAKDLIDNYYNTFPTVRKFQSDAVEHARENGYVETRMGRRRMLPDINSKNPTVRGYAERNAVNAPLQGTAADVIKKAMIAIYGDMKQKKMKSRMIMQVHDELNFNVVPEELPKLQELVTRRMEESYRGLVPLTASSGVASNWLDAH